MGLINRIVNFVYSLYLRHNIEKLFGHDGCEKSVMNINGSKVFVYTVDLDALLKWYGTKRETAAIGLEVMCTNCGYAYSSTNVVVVSKHIEATARRVFMWHEIGHVINKHSMFKIGDLIKAMKLKEPQIVINGEFEKLADQVAFEHTGIKITPEYIVNMLKQTMLNYFQDSEAVELAYTAEFQKKMLNLLESDGRFR